jgi:glycosyltransferase involved in cell wall biosynthesis
LTALPSISIFCSDYIVVAQHLTEIILSLSSRFHAVYVYTNCSTRRFHSSTFPPNVIFVDIPFLRKPSIASDLKCLFLLLGALKKYRSDLWLTFTPKISLLLSLLYPYRKLIPSSPRRIHYFTGLLWEARIRRITRIFFISIDLLTLLTSDFILVDSHSQEATLQKLPFSQHVRCLGHGSLKGVKLSSSTPLTPTSSHTASSRPFTITYLGRITPDKGTHDLIAVFKRLSSHYPDIHLQLVGPIEHNSLEYLSSNLCNNISYYAFTSDPFSFFRRSDLHVLPSRREGFGSTVLESAACGVPTVGTLIPGLTESISHGHTGLLAPLDDLDALYHCIEGLYLNPDYLLYLGRNAQSRVYHLFNQSDVIDRLCVFLLNCLAF